MSKELEALERQKVNVKELRRIKFVEYSGDFALIEKALKRNEPMKVVSFDPSSYYDELGYFKCPKCEILTKRYYNYCPDCGQKFDRSYEK